MNLYEKLFILETGLDEKAKEEQVSKVEGVISENGGEVLKTTNLGVRKLAYPIKKQEKGDYILLIFNAPPAAIAKLERFCRLAEPILKFMIIKIEKKKHIAAVLSSINTAEATETPAAATEAAETPAAAEAAPGDAVENKPETTEETKEDVQ
jgi:small subunit ribosomal protein S6